MSTLTATTAAEQLLGDVRQMLARHDGAESLDELRELADELTTALRRVRGRITRLAKRDEAPQQAATSAAPRPAPAPEASPSAEPKVTVRTPKETQSVPEPTQPANPPPATERTADVPQPTQPQPTMPETARWRKWHVVTLVVLLTMLAGVVAIVAFGDEDPSEVGSAEPARPTDQLLSKELKLRVAPEGHAGYARGLFADYDRQSVLDANLRLGDWTGCDAYYSVADDRCYTDAAELDVDHFVPLAEAWDSGASEWTQARRDGFARDPINLWLMTDNLNQSKGDGDIAEWVPPHGPAVCDYLERWVEVKRAYDLTVDPAELDALTEFAGSC